MLNQVQLSKHKTKQISSIYLFTKIKQIFPNLKSVFYNNNKTNKFNYLFSQVSKLNQKLTIIDKNHQK